MKMSNIFPPSSKIICSFFTFLLCFPYLIVSQPSSFEQAILLNIKQHWGNQPPMQSWNSSISHCQWQGINCTGGGTITGINLNSQNIKDELPASICKLKNLTSLDVGNNFITGNFPTFLYNCTKLQTLNLTSNFFVGTLPNDINRLSPHLQHLDLSANNFTGGIPSSLAQLKGLISLSLDSNLFTGTIPSKLGNLEHLEKLVLAYNSFSPTNLPKEFGLLKKLRFLWMSQCNLIGAIPDDFGNLTSLQHLDLAFNGLVGEIPRGLFLLKNLMNLYLYDNMLTGEIPSSIEALNLVEIDLSSNNLTGIIPEGIGKLRKLEILNLFENQLFGTLPPSIGHIPSLKQLKLFNNRLSGSLPPELGLHSKIDHFEVANNAFTGQLPQSLCSGGKLLGVVAFNNYLNGTIPSSLGQCNTLIAILLYNNSLTGVLPAELGFLSKLVSLDVSKNRFSGLIPFSLANCSALETLSLHHNQISGVIPSGLLMLPNIKILFLGNNKLSGKLPPIWSTNLAWLDISNNKISGPLPSNFHDGNLFEFRASNNQLQGNIPVNLTALSSLYVLLLDGNQLSGELPSKIMSWKSLVTLDLAKNHLSGAIPGSLGFLPHLNNLNLSNNKLSGQIPPELAQQVTRQNLLTLNLSSNSLSGKIPHLLDNREFNLSFLDNGKLCSDKSISNLPQCSSCQHRYLVIILVPGVTILLIFLYFPFFWAKRGRQQDLSEEQQTWELKPFHNLNFTETKIVSGLTDKNLIGSGGSGKVYKIIVNDSGDKVAVKRIWKGRKVDDTLEKQFLTEVEILGTFRHTNIVKLLCCVSSAQVKLLVYEYMEMQSLDKWIGREKGMLEPSLMHSHTITSSPDPNIVLDWPKRLKIAIGIAKALCYLHHDCSPPIIHRDVKSSNILLDSEFNPKIADFGLAKETIKIGEPHTASSVAGSFGYIAPEYLKTRRLNEKIDIYSFGVVLLELATGKDPCKGDEYMNLADWSWQHYCEEHPIIDALDKDILEQGFTEQMASMFKLGLVCTSRIPSSRPTMKQVLQLLISFRGHESDGLPQMANEDEHAVNLLQ